MIHHADAITNGLTLRLDCDSRRFIVAERQSVLVNLPVRIEPECSFPSTDLAENRALSLQLIIERGPSYRARGPQDSVWVGNRILEFIEFASPGDGVGLVRPRPKPPGIPCREIPFGLAFRDPFGDGFTDRGRLGDTYLNAAGVIEIRKAKGRPAERLRIR